ncbi:MAG: sulfurtransferase complex subunit TusB [Enterobacteriaceae bacterium]|jgi:tRNA 2-thiouridine synthesizing protein B|nr:sulfurtransferase complex subunit TusB [Enterobacteriaceae bacterium]
MLHTVSHSFYQFDSAALLNTVTPNDVILLLQDGVTMAMAQNEALIQLKQSGAMLYALREDVAARGLLSLITSDIELVDFQGFVDLTAAHYPQMTW